VISDSARRVAGIDSRTGDAQVRLWMLGGYWNEVVGKNMFYVERAHSMQLHFPLQEWGLLIIPLNGNGSKIYSTLLSVVVVNAEVMVKVEVKVEETTWLWHPRSDYDLRWMWWWKETDIKQEDNCFGEVRGLVDCFSGAPGKFVHLGGILGLVLFGRRFR